MAVPPELAAAAGILGPAAAIIGGLAAAGGLALILDSGTGSLAGVLGDEIDLSSTFGSSS